MATLTLYATSTPGLAEAGAQDETYLDVQQKASGDTVSETGDGTLGQEGGTIAGHEWYWVIRAAIRFDTSSLVAGDTITAATLSLYGQADSSGVGFNVVIVSAADLANPVVATDYGDLLDDTTSGGSFATSSWALEAYNDISLNATGLSWITKEGTTTLALRSSRDISQTSPKLNGDYYNEEVQFYPYDTINKNAKLTITYTPAPTFIPRVFIV